MSDASVQLDGFFCQFPYKQYKKGEILIRAGEEPTGIFYIKDGVVRQYSISKKGEELVVNIFKSGAFFPMGWAINDTKNNYDYEAVDNLTVYQAPREKVIAFLKNHPDVLYDLMSRIYKGLDGFFSRMTFLMAGRAYDRLITELLIEAKRFGSASEGGVELRISEKDLAAQSGMTRETVSREMKHLKDKGLVSLNNTILIIHDLAKLEDELASV